MALKALRRSVQVDSTETLDKALNTIKDKGFINYYGMFY